MKDNKFIKICLIIITISLVAFVGNMYYQLYVVKEIVNPSSKTYKVDPNLQWCKEHNTYHDVSKEEYPCLKHKPY